MVIKKLLFILMLFYIQFIYAQDIEVSDSTSAFVLIEAEPEYPAKLAKKNIKGTINLEVLVNPDSTYKVLRVLESVPELDEYAIKVLKKYKFSPAVVKSQAVASKISVLIYFPPESYVTKLKKINVDPKILKEAIIRYIKNQNSEEDNKYLNNYYYPLETHYKGKLFKQSLYKNNMFYEYNAIAHDNLVYQNYIPLYQNNKKIAYNQISNAYYTYRPAIIRSQMAMGESDLQYANISFDKNHILQLDSLNLHLDFFAHNGSIPYIPEKASNALISARWNRGSFFLQANLLYLDQEYGSKQLNDYQFTQAAVDIMKEKSHDYQYSVSYKVLSLAYRDKLQSFKTSPLRKIILESKSSIASLQDSIFKHHLNISWQHNADRLHRYYDSVLIRKGDYDFLELQQCFSQSGFSMDNFLYYNLNDNIYDVSGSNLYAFFPSLASGFTYKYQTDEIPDLVNLNNLNYLKYYDKRKYALTNIFKNSHLETKLTVGKKERNQRLRLNQIINLEEKYLFAELENKLNFELLDQNIIITHNCEYQKTKTLYYNPEFLNKAKLLVEHAMPRDNKISLGLDTYFASDFLTPQGIWSYSFIVDTFVKINITNLFDITISLNNLSSTESYLSEDLIPYNFNANVSWYFLN